MSVLKLKRGDEVRVISGGSKGATGKILRVHPETNQVTVEGVRMIKKHIKPSQQNPKGRIAEIHKPIDISNVAIIHPTDRAKTSRISYKLDKEGNKTRVYSVNNKEID